MCSTDRRGSIWIVSLATLAVLVSACASPRVPGTGQRWGHHVSVTEVVMLSQAGVEPDVIVRKIEWGGTVYNLTGDQYDAIRTLGVTPRVVHHMHGTYEQAVEKHPNLATDRYLVCWYLGADGYWYGGGPWGFHPDCLS
jgi:hypothetical protein